MNRIPLLTLLAPIALLVGVIAAQSYALGRMAPRPTVVATVDLERIFEQSTLRGQEDARRAAIADELQLEIDRQATAIDTLNEEIEVLAPGTEKHQDKLEQLQVATVDYQATVEFSRRKLDIEKALTIRRVYYAIKETAKILGEEMGYDIIFVNDSLAGLVNGTEVEVRRQVESRRMLYGNPEIDVTDEMIARMNAA